MANNQTFSKDSWLDSKNNSYQCPENFFNVPNNSFTWLQIEAKEIEKINSYGRGDNVVTSSGDIVCSWKYLIEEEGGIQESITHDWGEYDSVAGRLAQKVADVTKSINDAAAFKNAGLNISDEVWKKESFSARGAIAAGLSGFGNNPVARYKIDSSFVYQDSRRREYTFTFHLSSTNNSGFYKNVVEGVKKLEYYSCATAEGAIKGEDVGVGIRFPAIFTIKTVPSEVVFIKMAALTAVQPTWSGPWRNGIPTKCELQLTFTDVSPLYRNSITGEWRNIQVINKEAEQESNAYQAAVKLKQAEEKQNTGTINNQAVKDTTGTQI